MKKIVKKTLWVAGIMSLLCVAIMFICNQIVVNNARGKVFSNIDSIKYNKVGVLLGTTPQARIGRITTMTDNWQLHSDGAFKYPKSFSHEETFVEDVPATVEIYSKGDIQLCYWPLLGMWSTFAEFPEEGVWLSPTERVRNVTYRADSKGIVSGYTQNGNIFYLKQKIMRGGGVNHSKVLVLINPPAMKDKVTTLTNEVANW
jgi:hypothetical protein